MGRVASLHLIDSMRHSQSDLEDSYRMFLLLTISLVVGMRVYNRAPDEIDSILHRGMTIQNAESRIEAVQYGPLTVREKLGTAFTVCTRSYLSKRFPSNAIDLTFTPGDEGGGKLTAWRSRPISKRDSFRSIASRYINIDRILRKGMSYERAKQELEVWGNGVPIISLQWVHIGVRSLRFPGQIINLDLVFRTNILDRTENARKQVVDSWSMDSYIKLGMSGRAAEGLCLYRNTATGSVPCFLIGRAHIDRKYAGRRVAAFFL